MYQVDRILDDEHCHSYLDCDRLGNVGVRCVEHVDFKDEVLQTKSPITLNAGNIFRLGNELERFARSQVFKRPQS
jgi:hypothetical protein